MINRRALAVDYIHYFVLDEADEMLSRGTPTLTRRTRTQTRTRTRTRTRTFNPNPNPNPNPLPITRLQGPDLRRLPEAAALGARRYPEPEP